MLRRRRLERSLPLQPRRRPRRWDGRILLQIDVQQSETDGIKCFKFPITLSLAERTVRQGCVTVYLDCGGIRLRALDKLSTEASRDGAADLLLRLPATKNGARSQKKNGQGNSEK